jgi:hypothetical protein
MRLRFLLILIFIFSVSGAFAQYQELLYKTDAAGCVWLDAGFYAGHALKFNLDIMVAPLSKLAETARLNHDEKLLLETRHKKAIYNAVEPRQYFEKG